MHRESPTKRSREFKVKTTIRRKGLLMTRHIKHRQLLNNCAMMSYLVGFCPELPGGILSIRFNTPRPRQMVAVLQTAFPNWYHSMKNVLLVFKFHRSESSWSYASTGWKWFETKPWQAILWVSDAYWRICASLGLHQLDNDYFVNSGVIVTYMYLMWICPPTLRGPPSLPLYAPHPDC